MSSYFRRPAGTRLCFDGGIPASELAGYCQRRLRRPYPLKPAERNRKGRRALANLLKLFRFAKEHPMRRFTF